MQTGHIFSSGDLWSQAGHWCDPKSEVHPFLWWW